MARRTNTSRYLGLLSLAALWVGVAAAQDMPYSGWGDEAPPDIALPSPGMDGDPRMHRGPADHSMLAEPGYDSHLPYDGYDSGDYEDYSPHLQGHWPSPAPIESTGTWLRRGFWYAEADAVIWNRMWNRDDKLFAADQIDVDRINFFDPIPAAAPVNRFSTNRLLYLESAHPGQDGSVRLTLGNFLFRDARNRDHTMEFTAFSGGDWEQNRVITSVDPFGLFVPFYIDGNSLFVGPGNRSFDQSSRQTIEYESSYSSFELNYRVKQRLGRDQMVMDPNGCWHRAANSGFEREYLAGLRYMELNDSLDWFAEDIEAVGSDGSYLIDANNELFGFQLGTGLTYQAPRWSLGGSCKGGVFVNNATASTALNFTVDDADDSNLFFREHELSFIGEFRLLGRWHLTPSFSLRAAYELMYVESVALAPSQATFIPEFAFLNTSGDPLYHGASFGFEGYW